MLYKNIEKNIYEDLNNPKKMLYKNIEKNIYEDLNNPKKNVI
jgi:hypothetical protein